MHNDSLDDFQQSLLQCYRRLNNLINLGELNSSCCQLGKMSPKLSRVVIFGVEVDQF
jgi:hypothetical protein